MLWYKFNYIQIFSTFHPIILMNKYSQYKSHNSIINDYSEYSSTNPTTNEYFDYFSPYSTKNKYSIPNSISSIIYEFSEIIILYLN